MIEKDLYFKKSIRQIHEDILKGDMALTDLADITAKNIEEYEDDYCAWEIFDRKVLLEQAKNAAISFKSSGKLRALEGVPVGVKDIYNTKDFPTQMGSSLWKGFTPGNDARVVFYLRQAGAVIPGKTVTAEFAVHELNKTLNPHDIKRTPGTSSSGSAVAVALGMVPVAIGTQTAGSIIRPASFCGIYGCKPSFGLLPRTGMLKTTDTLDTLGFFTTKMEDLRRVFDVERVHGPNFPISHRALSDETRQNRKKGRPWMIGFVKTHTWGYASDYAKKAILGFVERMSKDKDISIEEIELDKKMEASHHIHETIYNKALSYYFIEEYKEADSISPIMQKMISIGQKISPQEFHAALSDQTDLIYLMDGLLTRYDAIISLSTAGEAPFRNVPEDPDPALMWTLTHLPVVNVPMFTSPSGMPFGLQVVSRKYNDYLLFNFLDHLLERGLIPDGNKQIESERCRKKP